MYKIISISIYLLLFPFIPSIAVAEAPAVPGQFLIKFNHNTTDAKERLKIRNELGVDLIKSIKINGAQLVQSKTQDRPNSIEIERLINSDKLKYFEPNYIVKTSTIPNDINFTSLWALNNTGQTGGRANIDIDAPEAWDLTTGGSNSVVAVVDTGIDFNHQDLRNNMWTNSGEIPGNNIDDDLNGVIDDIYGYNAINPNTSPMDNHGHGTHVAGTIGSSGNNNIGVTGVNWNTRLMALKFLDETGSGTNEGAISVIQYAIKMKRDYGINIRVLNNSWGGGEYSQALEEVIRAANEQNILFVVAAGNSANDNDLKPTYPANYDIANVISVAALDHNGNLASFSNYGFNTVTLAAPGVGITSTTPNNSYASYSGTSMATPHVSGVAALVAEREPSLTAANLKTRLLSTVKPLSTLDGLIRYPGTVSALNSLNNTLSPLPPRASTVRYNKSSIPIAFDHALGTKILTSDDAYFGTDLPFTFSFYGEKYSRIAISTNGRFIPLIEGAEVPVANDYDNRQYPGISVFNDDLVATPNQISADGGLWFKSDHSSATITWISTNYALRDSTDAKSELKIQAKLYNTGKVEFHYLDTFTGDPSFDYGGSATIGIAPLTGKNGERLLVSHNTSNLTEIGSGKALSFNLIKKNVYADFDGDGVSDLVVWRPTSGMYYILPSQTGFNPDKYLSHQLGLYGDKPLLGDWDGDSLYDLAVFRPTTGQWYFKTSGSNYEIITTVQWGLPGDIPILGDFDEDGISDISVFRPGIGYFTLKSKSTFNRSAALNGNPNAVIFVPFFGAGNDPIVGKYSGNKADDFAVVWQQVRFWTLKNASGQNIYSAPWGNQGDAILGGCDLDGDHASDRVVNRVDGDGRISWFAALAVSGVQTYSLGITGDYTACSADYDGDGRTDLRVFHPNQTTGGGLWTIKHSAVDGATRVIPFGLASDMPL